MTVYTFYLTLLEPAFQNYIEDRGGTLCHPLKKRQVNFLGQNSITQLNIHINGVHTPKFKTLAQKTKKLRAFEYLAKKPANYHSVDFKEWLKVVGLFKCL